MTDIPHLQAVNITPGRLARWRDQAHALGDAGGALARELQAVELDSTRHRLSRAAKAARHVEMATTGEAQMIARAVATEIEDAIE